MARRTLRWASTSVRTRTTTSRMWMRLYVGRRSSAGPSPSGTSPAPTRGRAQGRTRGPRRGGEGEPRRPHAPRRSPRRAAVQVRDRGHGGAGPAPPRRPQHMPEEMATTPEERAPPPAPPLPDTPAPSPPAGGEKVASAVACAQGRTGTSQEAKLVVKHWRPRRVISGMLRQPWAHARR